MMQYGGLPEPQLAEFQAQPTPMASARVSHCCSVGFEHPTSSHDAPVENCVQLRPAGGGGEGMGGGGEGEGGEGEGGVDDDAATHDKPSAEHDSPGSHSSTPLVNTPLQLQWSENTQ